MSNSSICVLVSGGLDSDVLLAEMVQQYRCVWPLYIRQSLTWEAAELYWLKRFKATLVPGTQIKRSALWCQAPISNVRVLSLPMADLYGRHWSTSGRGVPGARSRDEAVYLPGRNLVLTVKAAIF